MPGTFPSPRAAADLLTGADAPARHQESILTFGVCGSEGQSGYSPAMRQLAVQRLLLDVAHTPRTPEFLDAALEDTSANRQTLESLGLVRREGDAYRIAFTLFTREDVLKVRAVTEQATGSLVNALLDRRSEIDVLLRHYDAKSVDPKALAYIILGCFSLDWDGLDLTAEKGYRSVPEVANGGSRLIPWAEEKSDLSLRGMYWGSHNDGEQDWRFTSFGDHFELPRQALPDLVWLWELPGHTSKVAEPLRPAVERVMQRAARGIFEEAGPIMFTLRDGERTLAELAGLAGMDTQDADDLLTLLGGLEYVRKEGGRFRAEAPVLTGRDGAMVGQLRRVGWEVMGTWLSAHHADVKAQLSDLTPIRHGLPCADVFTQVWHYLFGTANRRLVEAGVLADPYAPGRTYKGFIPAVWHRGLRELR